MINTLINKLPSNLAVLIRDQYDALIPIFKKYAFSEGNQYYASVKINYETSCFFLGIALLYKNVIVPLSKGSGAFIGLGNRDDIRTVKIGNYILSNSDRIKIRNMERDFNRIIARYRIPAQILLFSDVKNFARHLDSFFKAQQYE